MRNSPPVVKSVAMQEATGRQGNPADEVYVCLRIVITRQELFNISKNASNRKVDDQFSFLRVLMRV